MDKQRFDISFKKNEKESINDISFKTDKVIAQKEEFDISFDILKLPTNDVPIVVEASTSKTLKKIKKH